MADSHGHAHANTHANTDSHLDPIAHAHTVVDGNANAHRHRRADSDVAAYHYAHSGAINQHTNVAPVTVGDSDQNSSNQYPDFNLVTDTDTSAAHSHADTYLYAHAATDGYSDANSHFHTIANIQTVAHSNQVTQETACTDRYGAAQSFTDWHPVCHDDQHAKAIANCNLYADGGP